MTTPPPAAPVSLPPALRLRIKALLESGLSPEEVVARLAEPGLGPAGSTADPAATLGAAVETVATEQQAAAAPERMAAPAPPPREPAAGTAPVSLRNDAKRLLSVLAGALQARERGAVIEFIAARRGEGTSTIARDFARVAAQSSERPVLLLDLDWVNPCQYDHFSRAAATADGAPGPAVDLGFDPALLLRYTDRTLPQPPARTAVTIHRIGATALHVTRIGAAAPGAAPPGGGLGFPAFWDRVRATVGLTVIDAPPVFGSFDGRAVSTTADKVVVVIEAENTRVPIAQELIGRLNGQGADIAGIVFNKRRVYIPRFIYRWL
ncbi:MAG: hypothetical protein RLZZ501_143 [Pseudomonadota bacterium]